MIQANLFMMTPTIRRHSRMPSARKPQTKAISMVQATSQDAFCRDAVVDDWIGMDWLSGEYTGKKARLKKELERLETRCCYG